MRSSSGISLVTYTYNDHAMVDELLRHAGLFAVPFQEILVVDDGSASTYRPSGGKPPARLIRHAVNAGPAQAKRSGIAQATGSAILSLDADIRPHPAWLKDSLRLLSDPAVGLVGGSPQPLRQASSLSAALSRTSPRATSCQDAAFAPGGCLLLRRDVWERIGGLDDFSQKSFEDYHLSRKILAHGYRLILNNRYPIYEKRHLDRAGYCRRNAAYEAPPAAAVIGRHGLANYLRDTAEAMRPGIDYFRRTGDPVLIYVFLLKTALILHSVPADSRGLPGSAFVRAMLDRFAPWPGTLEFFLMDLRCLNLELPGASPLAQAAALAEMDNFLAALPLAELGGAMEEKWVGVYQKEDATLLFDWHYEQGRE
jgi:glycosyltransferase involved in cell wall biosynthesis